MPGLPDLNNTHKEAGLYAAANKAINETIEEMVTEESAVSSAMGKHQLKRKRANYQFYNGEI